MRTQLKAVRTVYNIFLLSKSPTNQMVAQGALNQIVGSVFARVQAEPKLAARSNRSSAPSPRPPNSRTTSEAQVATASIEEQSGLSPSREGAVKAQENGEAVPPQTDVAASSRKASRTSTETIRPAGPAEASAIGGDAESRKSGSERLEETIPEVVDSVPEADGALAVGASERAAPPALSLADLRASADGRLTDQTPANAPLATPSGEGAPKTPGPGQEGQQPFFSLNELHTKDAYLVFRALCKLGMKPLGVER